MEEMQQLQQAQYSEEQREDDDSSSEMEQDGATVSEGPNLDATNEGTNDLAIVSKNGETILNFV